MTTKLITYQLEDYKRDYPVILEIVKSYTKWAKPMERVWLVRTNMSASDLRTRISQAIGNRGIVLVIDLQKNTWGSYAVNKEITTWMKNNMYS